MVVGSSPIAPANILRPTARGSVASAVGASTARTLAEKAALNPLRRFIDQSWTCIKKVSWPNRLQVRNLTILVFVVSFVVGLYITIADSGFTIVVDLLTDLRA